MPDRYVFSDADKMAFEAANFAAFSLKRLLAHHEQVRLLAATGASQMVFLSRLVSESGIDWDRVELFHLDEYVGFGEDHPASFARYIRERIIQPAGIQKFHLLDGAADPESVVREMSEEITRAPIHLAFAGIGENGHLAFNDPPADFDTQQAYSVVKLDTKCRQQQVGEGWFTSLAEVPQSAISITVPQLLKSEEIICVVPDGRKAEAVQAALQGPVTPDVPASALQGHAAAAIFLDSASSRFLQSN